MYFERVQRSLEEVRARIERACVRAGRRDAAEVAIVAVTKGHPPEVIEAAREAGLRRIGENRVREAAEKWEAIGRSGLEWHMVGHLQRNKVRDALAIFETIQSVDSLRLARRIDTEAGKRGGPPMPVLVQVNASGEEQKHGFPVADAVAAARRIAELPGVRVTGLMTMAALTDDRDVLRATFRRTREAFERCRDGIPAFEPRHLSMGMTNDYELAVEEGSTMVRLGTALFGERVR